MFITFFVLDQNHQSLRYTVSFYYLSDNLRNIVRAHRATWCESNYPCLLFLVYFIKWTSSNSSFKGLTVLSGVDVPVRAWKKLDYTKSNNETWKKHARDIVSAVLVSSIPVLFSLFLSSLCPRLRSRWLYERYSIFLYHWQRMQNFITIHNHFQ